MARISFDDLKRSSYYDIDLSSDTLENLFKALDDLDKEFSWTANLLSFGDALNKLTKEDIACLERHYNKKFNKRFLLKGEEKYNREKEKEEKKNNEDQNLGSRSSGTTEDDYFFDEPSIGASGRGKSPKDYDFFDDFDSPIDNMSYEVIHYEDLMIFLEKHNSEKTIFKELYDILNIDTMTTYNSKKMISSLKELFNNLARDDINFIESSLSKNFNKQIIIEDFRKMLGTKKNEKENKNSLGDIFRRIIRRPGNASSSRNSSNPFADSDEPDLFDIEPDFELLNHQPDNKPNSFDDLDKSKFSLPNRDQNADSRNMSTIIADSYFSILSAVEKNFGHDIIEPFKRAIFDMRVNSGLTIEEYVKKSNLLIDEMLTSLSIDEKNVGKFIQQHYCINFSPNKTMLDSIKELIGDELRYYQQENLPKNYNMNNDLGNSRVIKINSVPDQDGRFSILCVLGHKKQSSSYKFDNELFKHNGFSILSVGEIPLLQKYDEQKLINELFDVEEYELCVIPGYNNSFVISESDYYMGSGRNR